MAGIYYTGDNPSEIDYSMADGRVKYFELDGEILYDEDAEISVTLWEARLIEFVEEQQLNRNDGRGLHAFVYKMIEDGKISERLYNKEDD